MNIRFRIIIPLLLLSLGCATMQGIPSMLDVPPTPSMDNVPTGSSPMSGDWRADTAFGYLSFTVDPDGAKVTTAVFKVSNWTCGGTTLTTEVQSLSEWPLTDGQFAGYVNLNGSFHTMTITGAYDAASDQFTGTWEQDAHGSHCSDIWSAIPRK